MNAWSKYVDIIIIIVACLPSFGLFQTSREVQRFAKYLDVNPEKISTCWYVWKRRESSKMLTWPRNVEGQERKKMKLKWGLVRMDRNILHL